MAVKKTFEFFFSPLLKKFFQDMGRDPNNLEMILLRQKAGQLLKDSNKVINFPQKESFMKQVEAMKKSGDLVDVEDINISEKITDRNMFNNSFLNKPTIEGQMEKITGASNRIKQIQKEQADMYKPKSDAEIAAKYDKQNQESIQRFKDKMKKDEPEDKADGGRIGYYTGGITDVEPSLDDIGHGADALNARTRLMSPGNQATTSTGLNYLLAEDNDNMRIPFNAGGGGRRAFLKFLASIGGLTAAAKSGMIGLGEGTTKKAISETVKQSAGSGTPPPYFFKLVEKIKTMGDDITEKAATKDREVVKEYKNFQLTEDVATGEQTIQRMKVLDNGSESYYGKPLTEETYMNYKPGKGQMDETMKGKTPPDEYEEGTALLRNDKEFAGEVVDESFKISDDILKEVGETVTKKADGGRIGYVGGGLSKLGITGSSRKFLEKVFGKEKFKNLIENDPELHRGLLEVAEMFRSKDKSGLVEYMQNFLPQMSKKELEAFVVGSGDTAGIEGQLIRLGSGRDYKNKIEMIEEANNIRKLKDFDIDDVSKNAEGGRIGLFLGGPLVKNQLTSGKGLLRQMLNYMSKGSSSGKSGSEMLQMVNPKQFEKLLNDPSMYNKISPESGITAPELIKNMIKKTKDDRTGMIEELLSSARNIKKVDDDMIGYKNKIIEEMVNKGIDREMAETFADMMSKKIMKEVGPKRATPEITEKGLLELENIQKNLMTKDRKLQATGGLTTMLGE